MPTRSRHAIATTSTSAGLEKPTAADTRRRDNGRAWSSRQRNDHPSCRSSWTTCTGEAIIGGIWLPHCEPHACGRLECRRMRATMSDAVGTSGTSCLTGRRCRGSRRPTHLLRRPALAALIAFRSPPSSPRRPSGVRGLSFPQDNVRRRHRCVHPGARDRSGPPRRPLLARWVRRPPARLALPRSAPLGRPARAPASARLGVTIPSGPGQLLRTPSATPGRRRDDQVSGPRGWRRRSRRSSGATTRKG